jgi:two-component sensor histidine kinase
MNLWNRVSNVGLSSHKGLSQVDLKRLIFFNQVLFFGLFATWFQVISMWQFIGIKALVFLIVSASSFISLYLNFIGYSYWSKRFFVLIVYAVGVYTTVLIGGAGLYHLGAFLIFISTLLFFDINTEKLTIALGVPFLVLSLCIGEFGWFDSADFSNHEGLPLMRLSSLINLFLVIFILTLFIIKLNNKNEERLSNHKIELEGLVKERTEALLTQKNILEKQNSENVTLLKEVHHRVKNNLQIIVSLINLQLSKYEKENEEVSKALTEIQGRVLSMSLVHQEMYQTSDFTSIELEKYIENLIENIMRLYFDQKNEYELNFCNESACNIEIAIPIGLIFNEIVSNFFKHASLSDNSSFSISMKKEGKLNFLRYKDNGPGFSLEKKINNKVSLGLELIESLTDQIDGEFKYYNDNGAVYEIKFEKNK